MRQWYICIFIRELGSCFDSVLSFVRHSELKARLCLYNTVCFIYFFDECTLYCFWSNHFTIYNKDI